MTRRLAALLVLAGPFVGAGCGSESLEPPPPTADAFSSHGYADTLIAVTTTVGSAPTSCTNALPACGSGELSTGSCPTSAALGANDGVGYEIPAGGILEVALRCGQIIEHTTSDGTVSMDFAVWATLPTAAEVQIELSYDGSVFTSGYPIAGSPGLDGNRAWPIDLSRTSEFTDFARFVRIVDSGATGGVVIDAVEAY